MTGAGTHDPGRIVRNTATWLGYFMVALQIYLFNVQGNVIPFLQTEFDLSYAVVGLHSIALAAGVILVGLVGNRIAGRMPRSTMLMLAAASMAGASLLLCLAPTVWLSLAAFLLVGVGGGLSSVVVPAMMSDIHGERRSQALTEQAIIAYGFAIVGPLVTGLSVAQGLGWRPAVVLAAVMGIALILLVRRSAIPQAAHAEVVTASGSRLPAAFWAYWALILCSCALEFSVLLWGPAFLERVAGFDPATAATGAAGFFLGVLAGRLLLRAIVRRANPRTVLFLAYGIGALGFLCYWVVGTGIVAIVGIFLIGLCIGPQYPLVMALGLGIARESSNIGAARLTLAIGLAMLIAPAALGALADQVGLSLAHLTLPALMTAGVISLTLAGILERRAVS